MKFDAALPAQPLTEVRRSVRATEILGFDGVWTMDAAHDPFLPCALIADETSRMQFGTGIAVAFARSPMTLAQSAWDLAQASGGRFILGLGTQVRAHIERRFGMPWPESVTGKLRDQILAMRAIWASWQEGSKLNYRGEHYKLTLMTPFFNPGPIAHPHIPIFVAGVNTGLARLAGELADGFFVHPLHTRAYLDEVLLPAINEAAASAGRPAGAVQLAVNGFVATTEREREFARSQLAFYASTPSYRAVLDHHGWSSVGEKLSAHAARGEWGSMPALISDAMLEQLCVCADEAGLAEALRKKYEGVAQRLAIYTPFVPGERDARWEQLISAAHSWN